MSTSQSAAQFRLELDEAFREVVEEQIVAVTQKIALEALRKVVLRSPVDTGRFRANWNVSFGSPDLAVTDDRDKPGERTIAEGRSKIESMRSSTVIWISNNLPYANRLENGWSKQAPAGMVALTFAELATIARTE